MKAAVIDARGATPRYGDFDKPSPRPGEKRISVSAAALSPLARSRASGSHYSSGGA